MAIVVVASIVFYLALFFFHKHLQHKRSFYYSKQASIAAFSIKADLPKPFW